MLMHLKILHPASERFIVIRYNFDDVVELLAENGFFFFQKIEHLIAIVQFCYTFWRVHFMMSLAAKKLFFQPSSDGI